jgi:hypothetical protein
VVANRRSFEIDDGVFFFRDSFSSQDLIDFIDGKERKSE